MFKGFENKRIATSGAEINLRVGGHGPPLLLLHGYPQTHAMWHRIAPQLAEQFTVVVPDLRSYGDSSKPPTTDDHLPYSKREMAKDQVEAMAALGFDRFNLAGHDRGGRVAYRTALDHPACIERLATLDIVPTLEQFERMGVAGGRSSYHWYFLVQPAPFPERLIGADPDYFLSHTLESWCDTEAAFAPEALAEYLRCFREPETIHATCEDYRAGIGVDCEFDAADREAGNKIACPMLALWGEAGRPHKRRNVLEIWQGWADNVRGQGLPCGHFLPEEAPAETLSVLTDFFAS
ncbi:MAG: alpha/beta hydrolase [Alphaproteobacteria bacterium]|jgi:haloacetate dehalogenase|nr:alpha/beta hydrolase [Alphaproteobacteria bacterium]